MKKYQFFLRSLLALSLFYSALMAGPPMLSNDPYVPAIGQIELNVAMEREYNDIIVVTAPIIDFNYGIYQDVQFTLESTLVTSENNTDWGEFKIAFKWMFFESEYFAAAIYPQYSSYPIDSLFDEGEIFELSVPLNIVLNKNIDWVVDLDWAHSFDSTEDYFCFGTYLKFTSDKHAFYTEILIENLGHHEEDLYFGNLGYAYEFMENRSLLLSYGQEITNYSNMATKAYLGIQFIF